MIATRSRGIERLLVALVVGALALSALPAQAAAQSGLADLEVVAEGLNNPRGLAFGPDGALYVAEAGVGGPGPECVPNPEGGEPSCYGPSGSITRITDGGQQRVVEGLPSLAPPGGVGATGPHDIVFDQTGALVTIGLGADPALRPDLGAGQPQLGTLIHIGPRFRVRTVADLAAYEAANDPGGEGPDSNPYGLARDGRVRLVTDAGGNTLLAVVGGQVRTVAHFPPFQVPGVPFPTQAVPTSVAVGPDGAYYVGQLTGAPFPPGAAKVFRVDPQTGEVDVYAQGFTNIIDVTFDHRGRLLVLEIAKNGLASGDPTGRLVRVERSGSQTELASDGLVLPGGVTVAHDGSLYVTDSSIFPGGGRVLKITP